MCGLKQELHAMCSQQVSAVMGSSRVHIEDEEEPGVRKIQALSLTRDPSSLTSTLSGL